MVSSPSELKYKLGSGSTGKMMLDQKDVNLTQMPTQSESSGEPHKVEHAVEWEMSYHCSPAPSVRKTASY